MYCRYEVWSFLRPCTWEQHLPSSRSGQMVGLSGVASSDSRKNPLATPLAPGRTSWKNQEFIPRKPTMKDDKSHTSKAVFVQERIP